MGLGALLTGSAFLLLATAGAAFVDSIFSGPTTEVIISLLDQILLILLTVEILYTVQVSFREHMLVPEPFLIVGLIAATRRILIITAEFPKMVEKGQEALRIAVYELALLTFLIVALVASLYLLRKQRSETGSQRIS